MTVTNPAHPPHAMLTRAQAKLTEEEMSRLFLPPINRAMTVLDRSFFQKTVPITAARIHDPKSISRIRKECAPDLLRVRRMELMPADPANPGKKLMLLRPDVKADGTRAAPPPRAPRRYARFPR